METKNDTPELKEHQGAGKEASTHTPEREKPEEEIKEEEAKPEQEEQEEERKPQRARTLTEKGKEYQKETKEQAFKTAYHGLTRTLNRAQDLLQEETTNDEKLLSLQDNITIRFQEVEEALNALKQITENTREKEETVERLEAACFTIQGKIIAATLDGPSQASRSVSRHSSGSSNRSSSSATRGTIAAIRQRLKDEKKHRRRQQELEEMATKLKRHQRETQLQQEERARRLEETEKRIEEKEKRMQEEMEAKLSEKKREMDRLKLKAELRAELARLKAEESDNSQDLDTEDEEDEDEEDENKETKPENGRDNHEIPLSDVKHVQASLNPVVNNETTLLTNLANAFNATRLPVPEPPIFYGNPLQYTDWVCAFDTLIDSKGIPVTDKIHYLSKYLGGQAKECVKGYMTLRSESGYLQARRKLEERYGNEFIVAESFQQKLESWPKISAADHKGLQTLSDFLRQCQLASGDIKDLTRLNDMREMNKIAEKLPYYMINAWHKQCIKTKRNKGKYPQFEEFADFVELQAQLANDPIIHSNRKKNQPTEKTKVMAANTQHAKTHPPAENSHTRETPHRQQPKQSQAKLNHGGPCYYCKKDTHWLSKCPDLVKLSHIDRLCYLKNNGHCLRCLSKSHVTSQCKNNPRCHTCQGNHLTCLHKQDNRVKNQTPTTTVSMKAKVYNQSMSTTHILPVFISSSKEPEREILTYALLDSGSDATFIDEQTADKLNLPKLSSTTLNIATVKDGEGSEVVSFVYQDLQVRGYNSHKRVDLPSTYSVPHIPTDRRSISTQRSAAKWPHLTAIQKEMPPILDCGIGLLIGYNCSQALIPRNSIIGKDAEPFAVKTDLGWSIIGPSNPTDRRQYEKHKATCYSISTKEKPLLKPRNACSILEQDFQATEKKDKTSQDDSKLMRMPEGKRKESTTARTGRQEMPPPFRAPSNPPNHKPAALKRPEQPKGMSVASLILWVLLILAASFASGYQQLSSGQPIAAVHQGDPTSPEPLTPNHVITMKSKCLMPPPGVFCKEDTFLRKRWRRVQYLLEQFWARWRKEYVSEISKRKIWRKQRRNLKQGDIVLISDENTPRNQWPIAKVIQTTSGKDGKIRRVKVQAGTSKLDAKGKRTSDLSTLERPIQKLVLIQASETSNEADVAIE